MKKLPKPKAPIKVQSRKPRSMSSPQQPLSRVPRLKGLRFSCASVSGWAKASRASDSTEATSKAAKIPRQPVIGNRAEPASGASIGETENTSMIAAIIRVASGPVIMSRTMARGTTPSAAPPRPWTKRPAISPVAEVAVMQISVPSTNIAIPA